MKRRVVQRIAAATLVPAVLLCTAEVAVRVAGGHTSARMYHPVERDGRTLWQRNPERDLPWYPPYTREKPPGTLRVACIGGSTVEGYPIPEYAFPRLLEQLLRRALPKQRVEVLACGVGGHYSTVELDILREVIEFDPGCVVLYSGHNEFHPMQVRDVTRERERPLVTKGARLLRRSALLQFLEKRVAPPAPVALQLTLREKPPERRPCDEPVFEWIVERFRENLAEFERICAAHGVPLVLCTNVSNLRDFPPMANVFTATLPHSARARFQTVLEDTELALATGELERAQALLDAAARVDRVPAMLPYLRGRLLLARRDVKGARREFEAARDADGRLNRAPGAILETLRAFAGRPGVLVCDVERTFAARVPDGIPGHESIVDNVHPNLQGQRWIAEDVFSTLATAGVLVHRAALYLLGSGTLDTGAAPLGPVETELRIASSNLLLSIEKGYYGKTGHLARLHYVKALQLDRKRGEAWIGLGMLAALDEDFGMAREQFAKALDVEPAAFRAFAEAAERSRLVEALFRRSGVVFDVVSGARLTAGG